MMKFHKLFSIFILLLLAGCSLDFDKLSDPNLPYWSTRLEFPILSTEVTLETLAEDSAITIEGLDSFYVDGQSNDSLLVFRKIIKINKIEVGNKLKIDPISTSFSQDVDDVNVPAVSENISTAIDTISLANIDPVKTEEPFTLENINPAIAADHGSTIPFISALPLVPVTSPFTFDDFDDAVFSSGQLVITIQNELSIPLGDIKITLLKNDESPIGSSDVMIPGPISKGTSASGTLILSNLTEPLPGNIIVLVNGNSPGGTDVLIDKNSFFEVLISGSDLEIESASAKIPEQIIEEEGSIAVDTDPNKVIEATIKTGNLIIEVDNYMALESNLNITIPSIQTDTGNNFETSLSISGNTENIENITNMTGYSLVMDADNQIINYSYMVTTIDSSPDLIQITSTDNIVVSIKLQGNDGGNITFSNFKGYLDQDPMVNSSTIELENGDTKVNEATLKSGKMVLSITNGIGIAANVNFTIEEFIKNGSSLDTSFALSTNPSPFDITIDLSGYLLDLNVDEDPQKVNYASTINIPSDEEVSLTFGQSIYIDVLIDTLSFQNITGYIDPVIVDIEPVEEVIELPEELKDFQFDKVEMKLDFQSNISLPVFLDLTLTSFNDETGDSAVKSIDHHNITETPIVSIDDAQQLINILPNRITATGKAEVGDSEVLGEVSNTDTLSGLLTVTAPLSFIISDSSIITIDPDKMDAVEVDGIKNITLFIDYHNEFEFGLDVTVLLATDTLHFDEGKADTLISSLHLGANVDGRDSIMLDEPDFDLLNREENYSKAIISLLGRENGLPSRFLSTDTLKIDLSASFEYLINQPESTESPDE